MNAESAIALVVLAALCMSSLSQEDDASAWYRLGLDLIGNNSPQEAVQACDRAIEIDPGFADAWKAKASALASSGRNDESLDAYDRAIEPYDQAIASDPNSAGAWYEKGSALRDRAVVMHVKGADNQGQARYLEEAVRSLNKSIEIEPQNADAWQAEGFALYDLGRFEESLQSFERAMEIDPDLP
jgi:tetratricopeptide (TPR) repeat protein